MTGNRSAERGEGRFGAVVLVVAIAIGVVAGAGFMSWRGGGAAEEVPAVEHAEELPPGIVEVPEAAQRNAGLETTTVETRELPATIEVTGVVTPVESRVAHIRPLARGLVESVSVTLGARVTSGQALVTYDNIELGQLVGEYLSEQASLRQAEADLDVRQRALERAETLVKLEAVAEQTVELRRTEHKNAQAAVESQKARVARVEEQMHRFGLSDADLGRLTPEEGRDTHRTASHSVLRAPFGGVVTNFDIAAGELVEPERELMTISDISTVWVLAEVYEKDFAKVRAGTDVNIRVDAYPDRVFVGRLTYVSDIINPQTRTAKVRCVVENADGALKLDMFARVSVPTIERRQGVVIPAAAVQQVSGDSVVFIRQTPVRFARRRVQIGTSAGDVLEVVEGLKPGEVIASAGSFYLKTALLRELIGDEH